MSGGTSNTNNAWKAWGHRLAVFELLFQHFALPRVSLGSCCSPLLLLGVNQGVTSHLLVPSSFTLTRSVCMISGLFFPSFSLPHLLAILLLPKHEVILVFFYFLFAGPEGHVTFWVDSEVLQTSFSRLEPSGLVICTWPFWPLGSRRQQPFAERRAVSLSCFEHVGFWGFAIRCTSSINKPFCLV